LVRQSLYTIGTCEQGATAREELTTDASNQSTHEA
jgi:hypothetical protein